MLRGLIVTLSLFQKSEIVQYSFQIEVTVRGETITDVKQRHSQFTISEG